MSPRKKLSEFLQPEQKTKIYKEMNAWLLDYCQNNGLPLLKAFLYFPSHSRNFETMEHGSQTRFAKASGLPVQTINDLLAGRRNVSKKNAKRIVSALGGEESDLASLEIWRDNESACIESRKAAIQSWAASAQG